MTRLARLYVDALKRLPGFGDERDRLVAFSLAATWSAPSSRHWAEMEAIALLALKEAGVEVRWALEYLGELNRRAAA